MSTKATVCNYSIGVIDNKKEHSENSLLRVISKYFRDTDLISPWDMKKILVT